MNHGARVVCESRGRARATRTRRLTMKIRIWLGTSLFLAVVSIAAASALTSQDKTPPPMSKEEMEMMQRWQAYATPGAAHKALDAKIGKWSLVVKMYMKPGA